MKNVHLPIAGDHLDASRVAANRDVEADNSVALLDHLQHVLVKTSELSGAIVVELDHFQESRFNIGVRHWTKLGRITRFGSRRKRAH